MNNNVKEVKVSQKTDPKQLATSIIYSLKDNKTIKAMALGQAIMVLTKAVCMVNLFKDEDMDIQFIPEMQYKTADDLTIRNFVVFTIRKI